MSKNLAEPVGLEDPAGRKNGLLVRPHIGLAPQAPAAFLLRAASNHG